MGAAFSSWLWGKGDLCHCEWDSDTRPVSPKPQPTATQTGVFLVGCEILGCGGSLRVPPHVLPGAGTQGSSPPFEPHSSPAATKS